MPDQGPDPLTGLKDIHLPDPVQFWPPAPGWWLLGILLLALMVTLWWLWRRRQRRLALPRRALAELETLRDSFTDHGKADRYSAELSILLRRVALGCFPRELVAGLTGQKWLEFLDEVLGDGRFSTGAGRALIFAPYGSDETVEVDQLTQLIREWILAVSRNGGRPGGV
ncbi:MAG: DUF4381 domain-containing protein [Gammaproteobacteria bacterium]|nr:DUF4381 domain-containing protein [Gammaproteobacteria bacterium]